MIAVIDNYDSFTYNLVQHLGELGAELEVFRNDSVSVEQLQSLRPSHLVISPGPGTPEQDAGVSNQAILRFAGRIPVLGVCLGHQCIAHVYGGKVGAAPRLVHGKVSQIVHRGGPLFQGIPTTFEATRYHSLIVEEPLPADLEVLARTAEGEIMALRHRGSQTFGVQFHPESILTPHGKRLLRNFLEMRGGTDGESAGRARSDACDDLPVAEEARATPVESIGLPGAIERALAGEGLSASEAEGVMMLIMGGEATPAQIGGYLVALRAKGETIAEITGFARAMRRHVTAVRASRRPLVDTCGTGGDGANTFNISTTSAFVVAGAGVAIAKHGNRSVSSRCGSADVLQALGVRLDLEPEHLARCIDEVGFGFLFAPKLHPAMKHAIGPRREMKVRTVFNILGPLTNPAGASVQLLGVYDRKLVEPMAQVLCELGSRAAYVVSGADGLDELSTTGPNHVACLKDGRVSCFELDPTDYGFDSATLESFAGGDAAVSAAITRAVLAGERGARRDVVVLNSAAALAAAGVADDLRQGVEMAEESIDSGKAGEVLSSLVAFTQEIS